MKVHQPAAFRFAGGSFTAYFLVFHRFTSLKYLIVEWFDSLREFGNQLETDAPQVCFPADPVNAGQGIIDPHIAVFAIHQPHSHRCGIINQLQFTLLSAGLCLGGAQAFFCHSLLMNITDRTHPFQDLPFLIEYRDGFGNHGTIGFALRVPDMPMHTKTGLLPDRFTPQCSQFRSVFRQQRLQPAVPLVIFPGLSRETLPGNLWDNKIPPRICGPDNTAGAG